MEQGPTDTAAPRRADATRAVQLHLGAPTWTMLGLVTAVFALSDAASELAGGGSLPGGPLDELAHLSMMILVLWALRLPASEQLLTGALVASVAIDIDHLPGLLGVDWITADTPRPYTHSLLTVAIVLSAALLWRRRRDALLGIALGLVFHFWRDVAESGSGVSLLWPWTSHSFSLPHESYLAVMAAFVVVSGWRCRQVATRRSRCAGADPPVHEPRPILRRGQ